MVLDLALAIRLITAWLYTTGWSYASHYFGYFHVGLLALEVPAESFLIYSWRDLGVDDPLSRQRWAGPRFHDRILQTLARTAA